MYTRDQIAEDVRKIEAHTVNTMATVVVLVLNYNTNMY